MKARETSKARETGSVWLEHMPLWVGVEDVMAQYVTLADCGGAGGRADTRRGWIAR